LIVSFTFYFQPAFGSPGLDSRSRPFALRR